MANDDPERAHCVRSDAARKRAALRYTRRCRSPPPSLLRRETGEYDRARDRFFSGTGSSFGASSSRSSVTPVKRGLEELPTVKRETEAEAGPERRARGVVQPEDFLPPAEADALLPTLLARNAREVEKDRQRRRSYEDINAVLYEQGVASVLAFGDKVEEWRRVAAEQERIYVELTSSSDED